MILKTVSRNSEAVSCMPRRNMRRDFEFVDGGYADSGGAEGLWSAADGGVGGVEGWWVLEEG